LPLCAGAAVPVGLDAARRLTLGAFHGLAAFIRAGVQYARRRCTSPFDRAPFAATVVDTTGDALDANEGATVIDAATTSAANTIT
jgi:hypothetical protein